MRLCILTVWENWEHDKRTTPRAIGIFSTWEKAKEYADKCGYKEWTVIMGVKVDDMG